jgi:hypothetical protein
MNTNFTKPSLSKLRHPEPVEGSVSPVRAIATHFSFTIRHPERSEAKSFLLPSRPRPSAVEGPSLFNPVTAAAPLAYITHSPYRRRPASAPSPARNRYLRGTP